MKLTWEYWYALGVTVAMVASMIYYIAVRMPKLEAEHVRAARVGCVCGDAGP